MFMLTIMFIVLAIIIGRKMIKFAHLRRRLILKGANYKSKELQALDLAVLRYGLISLTLSTIALGFVYHM